MEKVLGTKVGKVIPYFVLVLMVIGIVWLITEVRVFGEVLSRFYGVIRPFILGAGIAYILNMPCSAIQRLLNKTKGKFVMKRSRAFSVLILLIIIFLFVEALILLIFPAISKSVTFFISQIPVYQQNIRFMIDFINDFTMPEFMTNFLGDDFRADVMLQNLVGRLDFEKAFTQAVAGLGGIGSGLFRLFLAIITSIYFLVEKDRLKIFITKLVVILTSEKLSSFILKYSRKLNFNLRQYVFVQTIDGLILGTLMLITLLIFRSPFALILALLLGIFNYVPFFGSLFGTLISVLVVAFTQNIQTALMAAAVMFIIQQLDGNVIQPKLMSESFAISPLLVIISITVGGAYGGILGMLVAIPVVTVIKDMIDAYIEWKEPPKEVVEENAEKLTGDIEEK
jgi:predicted PurR-regulated permease PerM